MFATNALSLFHTVRFGTDRIKVKKTHNVFTQSVSLSETETVWKVLLWSIKKRSDDGQVSWQFVESSVNGPSDYWSVG